MNRDTQMGRMILEASTGMHGDIARDIAQAWVTLAEQKQEIQSRIEALEKDAKKNAVDAECFRWWVHEAAANPSLVAKAIAYCVTEDDYRTVIVGAKMAKDLAIKAATRGL